MEPGRGWRKGAPGPLSQANMAARWRVRRSVLDVEEKERVDEGR